MVDSRIRKSFPWPLHIGVLENWPAKDMWLSSHFSADDISEGSFEIDGTRHEETKVKYTWMRVMLENFLSWKKSL